MVRAYSVYTFCPICARYNKSTLPLVHVDSCSRGRTERLNWVEINATGTQKRWGNGGTTSKTENVLRDYGTAQCVRQLVKIQTGEAWVTRSNNPRWAITGEELLKHHTKLPVLHCAQEKDWSYSLHQKRPDSMHTPLLREFWFHCCMFPANIHYRPTVTWGDSAKNKLETQETNTIYWSV